MGTEEAREHENHMPYAVSVDLPLSEQHVIRHHRQAGHQRKRRATSLREVVVDERHPEETHRERRDCDLALDRPRANRVQDEGKQPRHIALMGMDIWVSEGIRTVRLVGQPEAFGHPEVVQVRRMDQRRI